MSKGLTDRLADYPGLDPAPRPGTAAFAALSADINVAIWANDEDPARAVLKLMIRRGQWPLGTRAWLTPGGKLEVRFPRPWFSADAI